MRRFLIYGLIMLAIAGSWTQQIEAVTVKLLENTLVGDRNVNINTFYNSQVGITSSIFSGTVTPAILDGVDLLIIGLPDDDFVVSEITAMSEFLSSGGRIFFFGELNSFSEFNNRINIALDALGSSMSIANDRLSIGVSVASASSGQILVHPLTVGVNSFRYAAPASVNGIPNGNVLFFDTNSSLPWAGFDPVAGNGIVLMGDSDWASQLQHNNNGQFLLNLTEVKSNTKDQFNNSWNDLQDIFTPFPKSINQIDAELEIAETAMSTARTLTGSSISRQMQFRCSDLDRVILDLVGLITVLSTGSIHPLTSPVCPPERPFHGRIAVNIGEFTASAFQIFDFEFSVQLEKSSAETLEAGDKYISDALLIGTKLSFSIVEVKRVAEPSDLTTIELYIEGVSQDKCAHSDLSSTVIIDDCNANITNYLLGDGCSISDRIAQCAIMANNHGNFVSCVAGVTNDLQKDGIITGREKGSIQRCAARANIP